MTVSAKFRVTKIEGEANYRTVTLAPVYSQDKSSPNYSWSQATPSGSITLTITNPLAFKQFNIGEEQYITFEALPVEK